MITGFRSIKISETVKNISFPGKTQFLRRPTMYFAFLFSGGQAVQENTM